VYAVTGKRLRENRGFVLEFVQTLEVP
jgi:hypothetical protein